MSDIISFFFIIIIYLSIFTYRLPLPNSHLIFKNMNHLIRLYIVIHEFICSI